jgi:streptomycin 6-kinase
MIENLPESIPVELARRWSISSAFLIADTASSVVFRVTLESGATAILKSLKPRGMGELPGMAFLDWRNGVGAVRMLEREGTVCLLEDAGHVTLRDYRLMNGEAASNTVIADVIQRLHAQQQRDIPQGLTRLDQHFEALIARAHIEQDARLKEPLRFCAEVARVLLADQQNIRPLHGDLHHENIISGSARGWLAIDPQGLLGDPAYDVANVFGNPIGAFHDIVDPQRISALRNQFARTLDCSEEKILNYAIAHAGLSICWSLEDGMPLDESKNACERLAFINVARSLS